MRRQKGIAVLEVLLIVVVLLVVGGAGYYVWHSRQATDKTPKSSGTTAKVTSFAECVAAGNPSTQSYPAQCRADGKAYTQDVTASWKTFVSSDGKYTLKYPATWIQAAESASCSEGLTLLGANKTSVGLCAADGARSLGQIAISANSTPSEWISCNSTYQGWQIDNTEQLKVSGYDATKTSATYLKNDVTTGGWATGVKRVEYCFTAKGTQFIISYHKWSDYPDVLKDFNIMVTNTFTVK